MTETKQEKSFESVKKVLKKHEGFFSEDGRLLKNKVTSAAREMDEQLIKLLLSNKGTKDQFFKKVGDALVFDAEQFVQFVNNKEFLPDSYTAFKNKIGLATDRGDYISESKEVVLNWPYKDCVLEGGQTKEDVKRDEIFWNETLAPDEITRLYEPKVFTNAKRIDKKGEKKLKKFETDDKGNIKDNLIIKGNNLLALHSLKERFVGKVKLIYIDPPYNRDAEVFYNDNFHRSSWLTFMKNRLSEARKLMRDDGLIFIQIDDAQHAYLKVLCDEVFEDNFVTSISVQMSTASGLKISHKEKKILKIKEHILVYAKNKNNVLFNPIYVPKKEWDNGYDFYLEKNGSNSAKDWRVKKLDDVLKESGIKTKDINDPNFKSFYLKNKDLIWGRGRHHNIPKKTFELSMKHRDSVFEYGEEGEKNYAYRGRRLAFLSKTINKCLQEDGSYKEDLSVLLCDFWSDINTAKLFNEGGVEFPNGKKPEQLLQRIIYLSTSSGDIVLDFFLGSGGTAAVAHKMNRQYVGIEQLDYGDNDSVKRLNNVIKNDDAGGITKGINWKGGGGFVYMELAVWNEKFKTEIKSAKTKKVLEKIWKDMQEQVFLSWRLEPEKLDKSAKEFKDLRLEDQKKFLLEMLDNNHLYINYKDIDDKIYKVNADDKKLNKEFYNY